MKCNMNSCNHSQMSCHSLQQSGMTATVKAMSIDHSCRELYQYIEHITDYLPLFSLHVRLAGCIVVINILYLHLPAAVCATQQFRYFWSPTQWMYQISAGCTQLLCYVFLWDAAAVIAAPLSRLGYLLLHWLQWVAFSAAVKFLLRRINECIRENNISIFWSFVLRVVIASRVLYACGFSNLINPGSLPATQWQQSHLVLASHC